MQAGTEGTMRKEGEILLFGRREMRLSGVVEVLSFDEESVCLSSVDGELCIEGEGLKIGTLDTERGLLGLEGRINGAFFTAEPESRKKGLFSKRKH